MGAKRVSWALLVLATVGACSPTTSPSPSVAPSSTSPVATALGIQVSSGTGTEVPGLGGGCTYIGDDGSPALIESVLTSPAALSTFNAGAIAQSAIPVAGVGDKAVLVTQRGPFVIRQGNVVITLSIAPRSSLNDTARLRAAFETLGRAATQRIPAP
jgi:hypothetical protein